MTIGDDDDDVEMFLSITIKKRCLIIIIQKSAQKNLKC